MTSVAVHARPVITDLTVSSFLSHPPANAPPPYALDSGTWHRLKKDLYLYTSQQSAWLDVALADEEDLEAGQLFVSGIRVGELCPDSAGSWEKRPAGIWVRRERFSDNTERALIGVDVLFGSDAIDPRPRWTLLGPSLRLDGQPKTPAARLSVLYGGPEPLPAARTPLRVRADGKFKIIQISDTHMVTGVGTCKDAIDAAGNNLPESPADPLTTDFIGMVLDIEKPDLVVLTGDQVHHDTADSKTALFKVVAPIIERSIPFATVFGNHDSEGPHALSRTTQMSILRGLPLSLSEPGPEHVHGIGNFSLEILAPAPSNTLLSTLYFLDSHGQKPSKVQNPDYEAIQQSQIDWFTSLCQARRSQSEIDGRKGHMQSSLVFQHIPLPEFGDPSLQIRNGHRMEPTEGPSLNSNFYDALVKQDIVALACGHDHVNDFCALLPQRQLQNNDKATPPGPWLCYGGSSGFGGYCSYDGKRFHRRARCWLIDTKNAGLTTWKRSEYDVDRVDEAVLLRNGKVYDDQGQKST